MQKSPMPFKIKLILSILLVSIVPLLISAVVNLRNSTKALEEAALLKLESVRESKNQTISRYLRGLTDNIITMAHNQMITDSVADFKTAFEADARSLTADELKKLKDYYDLEFSKEYKNKTGEEKIISDVLQTFTPATLYMQYLHIADNSHPLGSKHLLDANEKAPNYSKVHQKIHPILREYLEKYALYDIFIFDTEGNLIYTVFKELDYATNLANGPYKDSGLGLAFKEGMKIDDPKKYYINDFERYLPSYEAPASFISTPIWKDGKKIGVLAFQMPLATINEIMAENAGLGKTGETYLVGADHRLRSDIVQDKEFNLYNSFNKEKLVKTANVEKAVNDKTANEITRNYNNVEVLSSYGKIKFADFNWAIIAEQSVSEALESEKELMISYTIIILISIVAVLIVGFYISNHLSSQIESIVEQFSSSVHEVSNSNQKLELVSGVLIKSVQTQISSITESAAAMDEISAMIKNNVDSSARATELSKVAKSNVNNGKVKIDQMMHEVSEISHSYDEIQQSMETNNQNLEKISRVISEIAEKTKVINEIVFQTKLLSFNASVEAARAGESGKGFAVVAEEVGKLAQMSGQAADQIGEMLLNSQKEVQEITSITRKNISNILESGRLKVKHGETVATECKDELENILTNVDSLDSSIREISVALEEQSRGTEEVNSAMKYLEGAANETSDMTEKTKEASTTLKHQAHNLRISTQELRKLIGSKKAYEVQAITKEDDGDENINEAKFEMS